MFRNKKYEHVIPVVDRLASYIEKNPDCMNNEDFMNHLTTLYTAVSFSFQIIFLIN